MKDYNFRGVNGPDDIDITLRCDALGEPGNITVMEIIEGDNIAFDGATVNDKNLEIVAKALKGLQLRETTEGYLIQLATDNTLDLIRYNEDGSVELLVNGSDSISETV